MSSGAVSLRSESKRFHTLPTCRSCPFADRGGTILRTLALQWPQPREPRGVHGSPSHDRRIPWIPDAGTARSPLDHRKRRTGGRGRQLRLRRALLARGGRPSGADARPAPSRPRQHAEQPRRRLRDDEQSDRRGALLPPNAHRDRDAARRTTRSWPRVENLHDFCVARGRPAELPPSPPAVAAWLDAPRRQRHCASRRRGQRRSRSVTPIPRKILAPARSRRVERDCPADRDSHGGPPLGQSGGGDQVTAGDRHSSSAPDSGHGANDSAGRAARATATNREAHSAQARRGRRDWRQAKRARQTGGDANGGYGATLHYSQGLAMRGCGQQVPPGPMFSTRK